MEVSARRSATLPGRPVCGVSSLERKSEGVMDDEGGESMELTEEVPLIQLDESGLERLVRG